MGEQDNTRVIEGDKPNVDISGRGTEIIDFDNPLGDSNQSSSNNGHDPSEDFEPTVSAIKGQPPAKAESVGEVKKGRTVAVKAEEVVEEDQDVVEEEAATDESQEVAEDDETETEDEAEDTQQPQQPTAKAKRNYDEFDPEDRAYLRRLHNAQYEQATARLRSLYAIREEKKQLEQALAKAKEGGLPDSWYENPNAYRLSPEYAQAENTLAESRMLAEHWQEQLINIENGQPWTTVSRGPNGQLTLGETRQPDAQSKIQVMAAMNEAQQWSLQHQSKLQNIQQSFGSRYQQAFETVKKGTEQQLNRLPENLRPSPEQLKVFEDALPNEFKKHPMTYLSSHMYGVAANAIKLLKQYQEKEKRAKVNKSDEQKAGPKAKTKRFNTTVPDEIDFDKIDAELVG